MTTDPWLDADGAVVVRRTYEHGAREVITLEEEGSATRVVRRRCGREGAGWRLVSNVLVESDPLSAVRRFPSIGRVPRDALTKVTTNGDIGATDDARRLRPDDPADMTAGEWPDGAESDTVEDVAPSLVSLTCARYATVNGKVLVFLPDPVRADRWIPLCIDEDGIDPGSAELLASYFWHSEGFGPVSWERGSSLYRLSPTLAVVVPRADELAESSMITLPRARRELAREVARWLSAELGHREDLDLAAEVLTTDDAVDDDEEPEGSVAVHGDDAFRRAVSRALRQ